jgi:hypothetical protein
MRYLRKFWNSLLKSDDGAQSTVYSIRAVTVYVVVKNNLQQIL